jgi:RNA polymerase sigma-70 factor, ECF subfamily
VVTEPDFEQVVKAHYADLYRFALSLAGDETAACDLTQEAFHIWATRCDQIRQPERVKSWLFTTLYREFLGQRRRAAKFPHYEVSMVESELPKITPEVIDRMDADAVMRALQEVEEVYRTPLMLFYLEECSYKEIAEILEVAPGTVMSRIARGKEQVRRILSHPMAPKESAGARNDD